MSGPGGAGGRSGSALPRRPVRDAFRRFWADDQGLSIFSAVLFVAVFVVPPLVPPGSETPSI